MAIIVIFWSIFGDRMANLGLIDFEIGLYIKVNVNARQNKFEVHIYQFAKNGHKLAQNGPDATLATWTLFGHNLVIFHPILTFFLSKCLFFKDNSNGDNYVALFLLVQILVFALVFSPRPHMSHEQYCTYGPKTILKMLG